MAKNGYSMSNRQAVEVVTADREVTELDCGKILTNTGASGAITLTLPEPSESLSGINFRMVVRSAQNFKVASHTVDTLVSRNDAGADSILSAQIGNSIYVFCDDSNWYAYGITDGGTYTIAT